MMLEQATVLAYQNGVALVQCEAKQGCGSCVAKGCGTKALSALAGEKVAPQFELVVNEPLNVGDRIELGLAERSLLWGVLWLYGIPLLVLIGSALLFSAWFENELQVAGAMLISTLVTFTLIKKILSHSPSADYTPIFVRKL